MNLPKHTTSREPARRPSVAVIGAAATDEATLARAEAVGQGLAGAGATLICGGGSGVMEAAARGSRRAGGQTVGILPGTGPEDSPPNDFVDIPIFTAVGQARNLAVVLSADAVIAVGGGWGTLSEIALARKHGRPVVLLGEWQLTIPDVGEDTGLHPVDSPEDAVAAALRLAEQRTKP